MNAADAVKKIVEKCVRKRYWLRNAHERKETLPAAHRTLFTTIPLKRRATPPKLKQRLDSAATREPPPK
jgi:hypothetical protein